MTRRQRDEQQGDGGTSNKETEGRDDEETNHGGSKPMRANQDQPQ